MPTPGGKLKAGDKLRFRCPDNTFTDYAIVVERLGNDELYSVTLRRADGKNWPNTPGRRSYDHRRLLLLEAHYWVFHNRGEWELAP